MTLAGENKHAGKTICPGVAVGIAFVCRSGVEVRRSRISADQAGRERDRYDRAVQGVSADLQRHVEVAHEESSLDVRQILKLHQLMLDDEHFHAAVHRRIEQQLVSAEWALADEAEQISRRLERTRDPYLAARVEDVRDMTGHILSLLSTPASDGGTAYGRRMDRDSIVVSKNLYISEVMQARRSGAQGYVTSSRALTSHAAILLKSFNIPSLGAVDGIQDRIRDGDPLVLDALESRLLVRPDRPALQRYRAKQRRITRAVSSRRYRPRGARTRDGTAIELLANIDHPNQVNLVLQQDLEGIGLFRTEFLLYPESVFPDEEEQYGMYRHAVEAMRGRPVVLRTFDIGADKSVSHLERCVGQNPALGMRGIRRQLLNRPQELKTQLRAVLRAGAGMPVRLLIPMVTHVGELREVKEHLSAAESDLRERGVPLCSRMEIGAMIEVPSAAISVGEILSEVDFVSVGTNDLVQYFTAADRDNEAVSHLADVHSESVVFLLRHIIRRAAEAGRRGDVTVCGELASDPGYVPLLLELGYRSLSISPSATEAVRAAIARVDLGP